MRLLAALAFCAAIHGAAIGAVLATYAAPRADRPHRQQHRRPDRLPGQPQPRRPARGRPPNPARLVVAPERRGSNPRATTRAGRGATP